MPCQKLCHLPTAEAKFECCVILIQNMAFVSKTISIERVYWETSKYDGMLNNTTTEKIILARFGPVRP